MTSISLDISHYRPSDTEDSLISRAGGRLYKAKQGGRNRSEKES